MELTLETLGISREEIQDRVVRQIASDLLTSTFIDEDGDETGRRKSAFRERLDAAINERIDTAFAELAEKHVLSNPQKYLESVRFGQTNRWGEPKREPQTILEHLDELCQNYLTETVNFNGKTRAEDSYNFKPAQTRIAYMIHQHLHYHIDGAVKKSLADFNKNVAQGIADTVKIQLQEALDRLRVETKIA